MTPEDQFDAQIQKWWSTHRQRIEWNRREDLWMTAGFTVLSLILAFAVFHIVPNLSKGW